MVLGLRARWRPPESPNLPQVGCPPQNSSNPKLQTFLKIETRRFFTSSEGLNSSLALSADELWPNSAVWDWRVNSQTRGYFVFDKIFHWFLIVKDDIVKTEMEKKNFKLRISQIKPNGKGFAEMAISASRIVMTIVVRGREVQNSVLIKKYAHALKVDFQRFFNFSK